MKPKKGEVTSIRPYAGDLDLARKISAETGIDLITVMSLAMSAGLKAIKANNYGLPTPLAMTVVPAELTNEPGEGVYPLHREELSAAADETGPEYKVKKKKAG